MIRAILPWLAALLPPTLLAGGFPPHFVVGDYHLIGRLPDSSETFSGRVELVADGAGLKGRRIVDGRVTEMEVAIETALAGEATVLRMRFEEAARRYESTCLVDGDLDNYARISCYRYRRDGKGGEPGLEALFIDLPAE